MSERVTEQTSNRSRASKACQRCNKKRVKCDATEVGLPCSRCRLNGHDDCALIVSRRGQYPRKRRHLSVGTSEFEGDSENAVSDISHGREKGSEPVPDSQVAAPSPAGPVDEIISPSTEREHNVPSYRNLSWAAMFDHFLDTTHNHRQDVIDKCSITYLGESFPLALVLDDLKDGNKTRIHHPGPPLDSPGVLHDQTKLVHPAHVLPEDVSFLKAKRAFDQPSRSVLDSLINIFLNRFYPLYPMVNRDEFREQYQHQRLPWILLHACCFVAATFCDDTLIHHAGFASRRDARFTYYTKAKALFDLGYEGNKIVVLQSVFLLTFWGGGPNDYRDFYSWISTAVTIAEKLGIHRSMSGTNMPGKDRSLLKRLWWLLVIRDASCATLVGLPFRINMEHGDAEMLTMEDFEHDTQSTDFQEHPLRSSYAAYQIQVARLSLILYDIDYARFVPGLKRITLDQVYTKLETWRQNLPTEVDWNLDPGHTNLLATCLSILHDHHFMLAGLGRKPGEPASSLLSDANMDRDDLGKAALRVSNAASAIVTKNQALSAPHETYQGIFIAGVVSYVGMRKPQTSLAQLGQLVVSNCQMVLHHVREAWDPSPWVLSLFSKLTGSVNTLAESDADRSRAVLGSSNAAFLDLDIFPAIDDTALGYGSFGAPLQSNPMLSALFEFPQSNL